MTDDNTERAAAPGPTKNTSSWAKRLDNPKITIWTVIGFMAFLAVLSAMAAGVGYITHSLGHPRIPRSG